MPLIKRYVGASATASNCSDALTTPGTCVANSLSVPRCVVATVIVPRVVSSSRIAQPSAAPSIGSVPGPELVDHHERVRRGEAKNLGEVLQVRAERRQARLDRLLVADVGEGVVEDRRRGSPGRPAPECRIATSAEMRPSALRSTVLPPVFGPETSSVRSSGVHREIERHDVAALAQAAADVGRFGCRSPRATARASPASTRTRRRIARARTAYRARRARRASRSCRRDADAARRSARGGCARLPRTPPTRARACGCRIRPRPAARRTASRPTPTCRARCRRRRRAPRGARESRSGRCASSPSMSGTR